MGESFKMESVCLSSLVMKSERENLSNFPDLIYIRDVVHRNHSFKCTATEIA